MGQDGVKQAGDQSADPGTTGSGQAEGASQHIVVIGAGIVGVAAAIWLQRDGHHVTLIDREGPAAGTSFGNGGVLASCAVVPVTGPHLPKAAPRMILDRNSPLFVRWSYLPKLAPWLIRYLSNCSTARTTKISNGLAPIVTHSLEEHQALAAGTGAEKWITPSDYLYVYKDRTAFEADSLGWDLRKQHGISWDELEGGDFHAYDPAFSDQMDFAVRMGDHGHITDPGQYVIDLAAAFSKDGGSIVQTDVSDIVRVDGKVTGIVAGGKTYPCGIAIIACGAWSGGLAGKLDLKVPMESERGYHVELIEPSIVPRAPVMIASGKFVVTPMDGRLRLAGIVEFGGLEAGPSKAPTELLLRNIRLAMPGLKWKETKTWLGHRPAPADSLPFLGPVPGAAGAYTAFGHHHVGLTAGPKTGRLLADLITGRTPNIDLAPYRPDRFT